MATDSAPKPGLGDLEKELVCSVWMPLRLVQPIGRIDVAALTLFDFMS